MSDKLTPRMMNLILTVMVSLYIGFAVGYLAAKREYRCETVGHGVSDIFRTDQHVYRICK